MMESIFASEAASKTLAGTMSRSSSTGELTTVRSGSSPGLGAPEIGAGARLHRG